MPTVQLRDPVSGQIFDVEESEAQNAQRAYKFEPATPDQVAAFDRERAAAAKPFGQKVLETTGTVGAGLASAGNVIGDVIPESLGGLSDAEVAQFNTEFSGSPLVKGLKEEHPIAFALGSSAPAIALGPAVGAAAGGGLAGGVAGTLAESAAVGLGDEAIASGAEGREFDEGRAVEGAQTDLAFSAAAQALLGVAGRVGNLFLFGGGNTMAKNVGRGLDETVGPVVPDDIRFESPLLEAETRSARAAAAASPGMPPGPARDEALRRAAADLNEQVRTQGGESLETTVAEAQKSASVADSPVVQRRIDEILTETTPAQTSWSADATQRLDTLRKQLSIDTTRPSDAAAMAGEAEAIRAIDVADEAIRAIDGAFDSAEWFKASAAARDRLDAIADALPESPVAKTIANARDWLGKSLADRGMWGTAADLDASLRGAARDKVATAARTVGGDLRGHVAAYVDADSAGRAGLRAPIDQAIEGVEELAAAHERFGTATPKQIEALRENAAGLRRRIALADDVRAAEGRAAQQVAEETPAKATMVEQAAEAVASHLEKGGKAALSAGIGRALTTIADFAGIPGAGWVARKIRNKVSDRVADQVIAAAKQYDPASPGGKRVKRIMDRMRARERQAGGITLKVGKGWTPKSESDRLVDDAIRAFDDDEALAEMSKADLRQNIVDSAEEAWVAANPAADEVPASVLKSIRASAKAAIDNIDELKASMAKARSDTAAAFNAAVRESLPDLDRAIELLKKDSSGGLLRSELGGIKANTITMALTENGALSRQAPAPGRGSRYHPTDKAREIIERMRSAERQRGAVTLGGKKTPARPVTGSKVADSRLAKVEQRLAEHEAHLAKLKEAESAIDSAGDDGFEAASARRDELDLDSKTWENLENALNSFETALDDAGLKKADAKAFAAEVQRMKEVADFDPYKLAKAVVERTKKDAKTGERGFVQASPDERQFSLGDIAKSPAGVVTGAGAAWVGINQLRRDEDLETADRVIAVDDAAQQRVRHTARVLAGLAEPPPAEGLTTALGRFGADYEDPRAAFEERKSILEKAATAPTLVYDVIGSALGDVARVSPELFQAASQRLLEGFQYLRENLPAEVKTSMLYPTGVPPSESAMRDWATQWNTIMNPESVLDDIERGTVSHLQIRTLEGAHPDIYQAMRTEVIAEVGANFQDIPWSTKMSLDLLFQADGLAGPAFSSKAAAMIGEAMQNASQRKAPGPVDTSAGDVAADGPSGLESIKTSVTNRGA